MLSHELLEKCFQHNEIDKKIKNKIEKRVCKKMSVYLLKVILAKNKVKIYNKKKD